MKIKYRSQSESCREEGSANNVVKLQIIYDETVYTIEECMDGLIINKVADNNDNQIIIKPSVSNVIRLK